MSTRVRHLLRLHAFSEDRVYRYTLWRDWTDETLELEERAGNHSHEFVMFIGLNPSTADETKDDPTIRKCIGFAKRWGYGALCMTNLFAFRATDPKDMKRFLHPYGPDNNDHLGRVAAHAGMVVAAWGVNGIHNERDKEVTEMMRDLGVQLHCLRMTASGHPEHPLYVPYTVTPMLLKNGEDAA